VQTAKRPLASLCAAVTATGSDTKNITVGVANYDGLVPDFKTSRPCRTEAPD